MAMQIHSYYPIENIPFFLFVIAALISLATYTWQFKKMPGAKPQVYGQVCKGSWLLFIVMIKISNELSDKIFWITLLQMVSIILPYFWFAFILEISEQWKRKPRWVNYIFIGMISCLWLGVIDNSWHNLFEGGAWLDGQTVRIVIGPVIGIARVSSYLLCLITLALSVRWVMITVGLRRRQALWFTLSSLFSLIGTILDFIPAAQVIAPMPLGFLLSGAFVTWGFYRWQVYNLLPVAQEVAVQSMFEGLLVVDEHGYIAEMNPAAKKALVGLPAFIGAKFQEVSEAWPALVEFDSNSDVETRQVLREYQGKNYYYQLSMTSLQTGIHCLGQVIVFKDITREKEDQAKILETEKVLSVLNERGRLGRELHDGRGQTWNYLNFELQTLRSLLDSGQIEGVSKQIERLIGTVKELNVDVRESIVGLNKTAASKHDFVASLQDYLGWFEKSNGITTQLILPQEPVESLFSQSSEVQLLRIIQESLTNIRKHAKAKLARVIIQKIDGGVTVLVEDDGRGFDMTATPAEKKSFGLQIMAERAAEAGGCLQIQSELGTGTKVMVQFCLDKVESDENVVG